MSKKYSLGIFAYGSLIDDPGCEINAVINERITNVATPFKVEFARTSSSRDGAPTLIPVSEGGKTVKGTVFILEDRITLEEGKNFVWRRETGNIGTNKKYQEISNPSRNKVLVKEWYGLADVDCILYTEIGSNIDNITPEILADLAIKSAEGKAGAQERDGISYLISAKDNGLVTGLSENYEKAILKKTGQKTLKQAVEFVRNGITSTNQ